MSPRKLFLLPRRAYLVLLSILPLFQAVSTLSAKDYASPTSCIWLDDHRLWIWNSGRGDASVVDITTGKITSAEAPTLPTGWDGESPRWELNPTHHSFAAVSPWQTSLSLWQGAKHTLIPVPPRATAVTFLPQTDSIPTRLLLGFDPPGTTPRYLQVFSPSGPASQRIEIPDSSNLRAVAVNAVGDVALVTHLIPKFNLPSTQITQGWVFTNAVSWITLGSTPQVVTFPLDTRTRSSANPEGIAWNEKAGRIYIALAGLDSVAVLDATQLRKLATERLLKRGAKQPADEIDLQATRRYLLSRIEVGSNPTALALSPDVRHLVVTNRLEDSLSVIDTATQAIEKTIPLTELPADQVRLGERLFHSGKLSFSGQFSCASCHPDGHTDGLNWDLPADGFNNFFNTRSLLGTAGTTPYGWLGETANLDSRFKGTLRRLFQHAPQTDENVAIMSYLKYLDYPRFSRPEEKSPARQAAASRGRELFEGKAGCYECHYGRRLTDGDTHSVGIGDTDTLFDTPSLRHVRETAPYLHDGRAATLKEIFTQHNPEKLHGNAADLTPDEMNDLIAYLESL